MITSDFDYRNISYFDLYLEYKNKFPGKPDWFFKALAKHFDQMFWYIDRSEKNTVGLRTAVTDEAKIDGLYALDYYLKEVAPVGSEVLLHVVSPTYPIVIPKTDIVIDIQINGDAYKFYTAEDIIVNSPWVSVPIFEGSPFSFSLGTTVLNQKNQRFNIPIKKVVWNSVEVDLDGDPYTRKIHLMDSTDSDRHFRNYYKDGYQTIEFGNGEFGIIPPVATVNVTGYSCQGAAARAVVSGTAVSDSFTSTGALSQSFTCSRKIINKYSIRLFLNGVESQLDWQFTRNGSGYPVITVGNGVDIGEALPAGSLVITYSLTDLAEVQYSGGNTAITEVYLEADLTNGSDLEDIDSAVELAPKLLATSYRLGTEIDFRNLAMKFSPDILDVKVLPYYYGEDTVGVHIIAKGGGPASGYLVSTLSNYLNSEDVEYLNNSQAIVSSAYYTKTDVTYQIKKARSYQYKDYMELSKMAVFLYLAENYKEYRGILRAYGSQAVVAVLNKKLGLSLISSKAGELIPVFNFIDKKRTTTWGVDIEVVDIATLINSFIGVAELNLISPTTDFVLVWDRATGAGNIVCTEII
jgi:hypothetical protein